MARDENLKDMDRERRRTQAQRELKKGARPLSSVGLTPGTPLMAMIQHSLTYYICCRLHSSTWQHLHFELSGATVEVGSCFTTGLQLSDGRLRPQGHQAIVCTCQASVWNGMQ